jgi:hypothetical protein
VSIVASPPPGLSPLRDWVVRRQHAMNPSPRPHVRWLDFSGAPPMLIPRSLARSWRGTTDPTTGEHRELDQHNPITDYDRAVAAAWPGRSILEFMGTQILVLYSEYDQHAWDSSRQMLACGGWLPADDVLRGAAWTDPIRWRGEHTDYLLMNSAADAADDLRDDDFMPVQLSPGIYTVEYSDIAAEFVGCFHRFIRV